MKLLLTNPNFRGVVIIPSFSLVYLGTYIRDHSNCQVEIVEPKLQGLNEAEVLAKTKDCDFLGLTCYTESRFQVFNFAQKAKELNSNCKVIVGGPHVNKLDKAILEHYSFIDAIVRGEGEETLLEVIQGNPLEGILGLTWRNAKGEVVRNGDRWMMKTIDHLYGDYSLVATQVKGWKDMEISQELQKLNALPIIASRGCPFRCAFCSSHQQWGEIYRGVTPAELVKRLKELSSKYNIGYFRFYDALFTGDDQRILKFCDLLEKENLGIHFRIDVRVGTKRELLKRLREVGCDVVGFGVESGSDKILKRMKKDITRAQIEETIKICREFNYWMIGFFIVSLPDETMEDIKKTLELLKYFDETNLQFYKVHPNTAFYEELKQNGEINDRVWFDPNYGFKTEFGDEVLFCKEMFPSANFHKEEMEMFLNRINFNYTIYTLQKPFRRHGLFKGLVILFLAVIRDILLRTKTGANFYYKLENNKNLKTFYKRLCQRSL